MLNELIGSCDPRLREEVRKKRKFRVSPGITSLLWNNLRTGVTENFRMCKGSFFKLDYRSCFMDVVVKWTGSICMMSGYLPTQN